ncbi:Asp23/Gls24 family envelope stress response protein [Actinoallomurus iriomotensis]|nr:Asp23/Gls24 family envelope stress response protein [Actinoallomurus iriomotensis]
MTVFADGVPEVPAQGQAPAQAEEQVNVLVTDPPPGLPPAQLAAQVKGRIDIEDEVVEKVAGLAAIEVEGVADLGGDVARAVESVRERIGIGHRRGDQGVKARIDGREVSIEVTIVIEYGHVVMDVARQVKTNVAIQTNRMLGLRVVEVNVIVDDVRMPAAARPAEPAGDDDQRLTIG